MKKWIITGLVGLCGLSAWAEVTVTNLVVAQREGTKLVDISYDVFSTQPNVIVSLEVKNGAVNINASNLTGDVGTNVICGTSKHIVWDMTDDWSGNIANGVTFLVTAEDVIPAGGDPTATSWTVVNSRWVKNHYADGATTMSDLDTGRMWWPHGCIGRKGWSDSINYCNGLYYAGHSDWRLPDKDTLSTIFNQMAVFSCYNGDYYWSSTTYNSSSAWYVDMGGWPNTGYYLKTERLWVWPVRN